MNYPQINTYPLTLGTAGNYAESLKTAKAAFTPRQSVFFKAKENDDIIRSVWRIHEFTPNF